ncbi:nucleotidyltransferase family protein [Pontivivens insulae]|uniref:Uncharacterized protein n=1 Tax=Pontivivens insulae TaxID=1639689 RepID=A0A2R8AG48_9RHOB|nr:GSU2403 family nucleotidyltransferase fold protein [Pontivivens insulae]RED10600.1 hypothetical protein DFR53_3536 [Pontivivens insulae]SPF31189.1 hypothetical protein POI8812_03540 [Pontivivens insulae]
MAIERHSQIAQIAFHDLLRLLLDEVVSGLRGTPTPQKRGGRTYWYDSYRVGSDVRKAYIGQETPQLLARFERLDALREDAKARAAERSRLVRLLRADRLMSLDHATSPLLGAMAGAGAFRLGGTVVGTQAFRLYEGELGLRLRADHVAMTGDLDIASFERLSLALDDRAEPRLADVLAELDFEPMPTLDNREAWRWRQTRGRALVEFLTPACGEEEVRPLAALEVRAQALRYLNYLIADRIPAAGLYRSGVLVQVPRPERFAIHKLIVSTRRTGQDRLKAAKDVAQARLLIRALAKDRPNEIAEALADARGRGPKWTERIETALGRAPDVAEVLV